ncbi:MAG: EAL domain-containing protein [Anaerostipes hadrus]
MCEELYETISDFQSVGIEICLDDFGSGYANLNTILKLPFSTVKLDRSMLHGICEDQQVALLYKNMVSIMQNLGHKVVAEGVETQEEVNWVNGVLTSFRDTIIQDHYRVDLLSLQM